MGKRWDVGGWAACLPPIRADGSRGYVVHGPCSCPQDCVSDVVFVMHCECSVEAGPLSGFFSKELDLGWVEGRDAGAEQGRDSRWAHRRGPGVCMGVTLRSRRRGRSDVFCAGLGGIPADKGSAQGAVQSCSEARGGLVPGGCGQSAGNQV